MRINGDDRNAGQTFLIDRQLYLAGSGLIACRIVRLKNNFILGGVAVLDLRLKELFFPFKRTGNDCATDFSLPAAETALIQHLTIIDGTCRGQSSNDRGVLSGGRGEGRLELQLAAAVLNFHIRDSVRTGNGGVHAVGKLIAGLGGQRHRGGVGGVGRKGGGVALPSDSAGVLRGRRDGALGHCALDGCSDVDRQFAGEGGDKVDFIFNYFQLQFITHSVTNRIVR